MAWYQLKPPYSERECLPTAFHGEIIDLSGKGYERIVPASLLSPERRIQVRGATQQDLESLYHSGGHAIIEKVDGAEEAIEEPAKPKRKAKKVKDVGAD